MINKTILTDVDKSAKECASLQKELKAERMRLIKDKVREKLGDAEADKIEVKEGLCLFACLLSLIGVHAGGADDGPSKYLCLNYQLMLYLDSSCDLEMQ